MTDNRSDRKIGWADQLVQEDAVLAALVNQEEVILQITELIHDLMNEQKMNRTQLAARMRKSKGHVSQLLNGEANMTLRTLADILFALKTD